MKEKLFKKNRKSQITVFVIIALVIVAIIAILVVFYPNIKKFIAPSIGDMMPNECIQKSVRSVLDKVLIQGGQLSPELYFRYNNRTLAYLCYTSEWYKTCTMQQPFLKQAVEIEVNANASAEISKCLSEMKKNLENHGYSVTSSGSGTASISIVPKKIIVALDMALTLEKNDVKQTISASRLTTEFSSNDYEIIMVASSIQNYEARFGDSTPESYMNFYPNLRVEKKKQSDGTKVYIISDRNTLETLQFATRSLAWPPGYAIPTGTAA